MAITNIQDSRGSKGKNHDLERRLDDGVEESFPASDPVALAQPHDPEELGLRRPLMSPTAWLVVGGGLLAVLAAVVIARR
jgi:hypothetical protein